MKWLPLSCQYFIAAIILKMIIHILVLDGLEKELVIIEYYNQLTSCLFCVSFKVRSIRFSHQYRLLPIWLSQTTLVLKVGGWDVVNKYARSERDIEVISVILHVLLFGHECFLVFQTT